MHGINEIWAINNIPRVKKAYNRGLNVTIFQPKDKGPVAKIDGSMSGGNKTITKNRNKEK